jgi:hypothetical protein
VGREGAKEQAKAASPASSSLVPADRMVSAFCPDMPSLLDGSLGLSSEACVSV